MPFSFSKILMLVQCSLLRLISCNILNLRNFQLDCALAGRPVLNLKCTIMHFEKHFKNFQMYIKVQIGRFKPTIKLYFQNIFHQLPNFFFHLIRGKFFCFYHMPSGTWCGIFDLIHVAFADFFV